MLRRTFASSLLPRASCAHATAAGCFASSLRFGGGGGAHAAVNHAASMTGHITAEQQAAIDAQAHRTVSSYVPGKMFMRHWLAGAQATESIYNRILSLGLTGALVVYGAVYAAGGTSGDLSVAHMTAFALLVLFVPVHTHHNWHAGVLIAAFAVSLWRGLLH